MQTTKRLNDHQEEIRYRLGESIGRDRESHGDWLDPIQLTAMSIAPHAR